MRSLYFRFYTASIGILFFCNILQIQTFAGNQNEDLIYPLKEISKLECRFQDFDTLGSNCKQTLPILKSKDYNTYAQKNGGYNDFTRIYTVLWGASYKYGWDVGSGGHQGTDIATAKGTPVYSIADGRVIESGFDLGWGNYVSIEHNINGEKIVSNYAHLAERFVEKGDSLKIGKKIGEVGSTGNSTGNHLHFQIDKPSIFHPYYYDYTSCPYGYYTITETGVCFEDLQRHTYDPMVFLENNGMIEDMQDTYEIEEIHQQNTSINQNNKKEESSSQNIQHEELEIFSISLSPDFGETEDVKEMQRIYHKLGYYNGNISGNYDDIYESIITYQLDRGVINERSDLGAGWFGPKTRAQTKSDYNEYVASGGQSIIQVSQVSQPGITYTPKVQQVHTISRENLMTREEREEKAMQDFLKENPFTLSQVPSEIGVGESYNSIIELQNSKGKPYRGNTPGLISFEYDTDIISIFPESFFYFKDGERDIQITGKSTGKTNIQVKLGDVVITTINLQISELQDSTQPKNAQIFIPNESTALVVMKNSQGNHMIHAEYAGQFEIAGDHSNIEYCVKRGTLNDILEIYKRECRPEEYQSELEFSYNDTVGGILIFDYKLPENVYTDITLNLKEIQTGKNLANNISIPIISKNISYAD